MAGGQTTKAWMVLPSLKPHPIGSRVLGQDWLNGRLSAARASMQQRTNLSPSAQGMSLGRLDHPLIGELYEATNPTGVLDGDTPLFDLLEVDLNTLGDNLPDNARPRLRDAADCAKIMYEIHIGAALTRAGHSITWPHDTGKKRPDLILQNLSHQAISVECKKRDSRDGYEQAAHQFFKHFQFAMRQRMGKEKLHYWVKIEARDFRPGDVDRIAKEACTAMRSMDAGSIDLIDNRYTIEFLKLADAGASIPAELIRLFPNGDLGINMANGTPDQFLAAGPNRPFARGEVSEPLLLRVHLIDDPSHKAAGVVRNLKSASKQVSLAGPSLVYIDANFSDFQAESDEFDILVDAIRRELERAHTRVSAVVLTSVYPARSQDGVLGWRIRAEFIEQERATYRLSDEIMIPGRPNTFEWVPGDWRRGA
jgi:hypothetical protein